MKLRVGVVGLSDDWPTRHRPALRALRDRFEVRAICSGVAALAEQAARDFDAVAVDGFRTLAARPDIDAVLILNEDWFGPLPIVAACDSGKAVYSASVLNLELERARGLKQRVDSSGVAFMAELPRRQSPATLRLKELIATRLGRPRLLFCHIRQERPSENGRAGRQRPRSMKQELLELVDWCRYVVDSEPSTVFGTRHVEPSSGEADYQMLSLDFSPKQAPGTGPVAQISCGRYMQPAWRESIAFRPPAQLQVSCERGVAFIDLPATFTWFDEAGRHLESLESERPVGEQLFMQFHRDVTSLVRRTSGLNDAYRALEIVYAAETSCSEGRRLEIE